MKKQKTAVSKEVTLNTTKCCNCSTEVLTESNNYKDDEFPDGIKIVIGGGNHMTTESTGWEARSKNWRKCRVIIKWFTDNERLEVEEKYLCPSCISSLFDPDF